MDTKIQTAGTDECCPGNCNQCPEVKGVLKNSMSHNVEFLKITNGSEWKSSAHFNIPHSSN